MIKEIPTIFQNTTFSQFERSPKHWNSELLQRDVKDIADTVKSFFGSFNASGFSGRDAEEQEIADNYLKHIQTELDGLYEFLLLLPIYSHIEADDIDKTNYFFFLDMNTIVYIFQYCWLIVLETYINILKNSSAIIINTITKGNNKEELEELSFETVDSDSLYAPIKKEVGKLLVLYINTFADIDDNIIGRNYESIIDKVAIMKQGEKKNLATKFLGKLNREELRIENLMKQFKLGNWAENVHFFRYNKQFEDEASKLLNQYQDPDDENYNDDKTRNMDDADDDGDNDEGYGGTNEYGYNDEENDFDEYDNNEYNDDD